jgi:hypothetical protein
LKKIFFTFFFLYTTGCFAQSPYWQQRADYVIDVTLDDTAKTVDGFEKITYTNNSPDTLKYIWFHLWPNAYKNDQTSFTEQELINGNTTFYFSDKKQKGYINRLDFKVNGTGAKTEDHPSYIDVIKVLLPQPLLPGQQVLITTPFHEKLPFNFSRGGYDGNSFQVTQWYPKPAVYDATGWHPIPYLDQGEFYSEFGSFDVRINAPAAYVIAATGKLQGERGDFFRKNMYRHLTPVYNSNTDSHTMATWQFKQDSVHDFAWFADKNFFVDHDTVILFTGKKVDLFHYYSTAFEKRYSNGKNQPAAAPGIDFMKDAIRFYSSEVGPYPYDQVSVVEGPPSFGGGMEYPTITIISPTPSQKELDVTIAHEIGHNWFYGILASNEREHPWMDEGVNSFFERKYTRRKYGEQTMEEELLLQTLIKSHKDQPIETSSENFSEVNYQLVAYYKTARWLELVESKMGEEKFHSFITAYFKEWKYKHPTPGDVKKILAEYLPAAAADSLFALQYKKGILPGSELKGFRFVSPLNPVTLNQYLKHPTKDILFFSPAPGVNAYDGFMIGAIVSNYKLPPSRLQFIGVPLYGLKSKTVNGIGRVEYNFYTQKPAEKIELFTGYSSFSNDVFTDEKDVKHLSRFEKITGGALYRFPEKNPLSQLHRSFQWKSFLITEHPFVIGYDSVFSPPDTIINQVTTNKNLHYSIHQLKFELENQRTLYPYGFTAMMEGEKHFLRLTVEGNYFFNYRESGLAVRVFGGKFFYNKESAYPYGFYIDRFFLDMSATNGYGDYTYSNYFIGRNEFEGANSRQVAIRDGGFKIRTDLLGKPVGRSDDWLASVNLNTGIPSKLNPLSVLPIKIPLHLFLDIGTYAGAIKNNSSGRFLYDAGLHVPLLGGLVNFYFPLLYSNEYRDYVKSVYEKNRFIKRSTFTIDLKKADKEIRKKLYL